MLALALELVPMPGHLPLGMAGDPVGGLAVADGDPDAFDGVLVVAVHDVGVDPLVAEVAAPDVVELELGAAAPGLPAANATEVPAPTSAPLNSTAAMNCLVRLFMVTPSLMVRLDTAML